MISEVSAYLLKAVIQQGELLVASHDGGGQGVLCEAALRLLVHEEELTGTTSLPRQTPLRVNVSVLRVCVLPLIIVSVPSGNIHISRCSEGELTQIYLLVKRGLNWGNNYSFNQKWGHGTKMLATMGLHSDDYHFCLMDYNIIRTQHQYTTSV